ncbi:hypothetical protein FH972_021670 [Carpinus fangiana]|uniref:Uncharacterized protein n=1 Tax=Carpinus fangiana TaxID=176857 RepID=A0A5N6KQ12_9ROSI|nr:hypothetical protein FH972_021670 [Carpinus fangiana]
MAIREDLVTSAVTFLQDPSVANAPLEKRVAFLQSKNLTQEEVDASLARAGDAAPAGYAYPQQQQQQVMRQAPPPYGYAPYSGAWQQPAPPEVPKRDWRDYFIMATVMSGLGYGAYFVANPPTPPQLEQDKASIDESFARAFELIEQVSKDTESIKASEEARKERLDAALQEMETAIQELKQASRRRDDDTRRISDEVRGLQGAIPKAMKTSDENTDLRMRELNTELRSLKTLLSNRMNGSGSSSTTTTAAGAAATPAVGAPTRAPQAATPSVNGSGANTPTDGAVPGAASSEKTSSLNRFGSKGGIPAWQMAAAKKSEEKTSATSESGTAVEEELRCGGPWRNQSGLHVVARATLGARQFRARVFMCPALPQNICIHAHSVSTHCLLSGFVLSASPTAHGCTWRRTLASLACAARARYENTTLQGHVARADKFTMQTLGGLSHNASAIPLPSSALKRSNSTSNFPQAPHTGTHGRSVSGSRMSLAPGRPNQPLFQRTSSGSNLAEMGLSTAQRASMMGSTGGRKSYAPVTPGHGASALQMQQSQRRSSVYSGRQSAGMGQMAHQSFFSQAPAPAGVPRDPRPLKDRGYQAQIGQELLDYLTMNNFEMEMKHSLTQNTMRSPTQKDFNYMFQWLYNRVDPGYRFHQKIDAEVPNILKQLRYPFEKSITKSQIAAVGGNNWGTFLGMLHWLMQLARMGEQYDNGAYDDACLEAGLDVSSDRIVFDFLTKSYHSWLAMDDDADDEAANEALKPHVSDMEARFNAANAKYLEQVRMLEAEHKSLQDQIDELNKTGPRIAKLEEQIKILEEDKGKFESWNSNMEAKVEKYEHRAKLLEDEIVKTEDELNAAEGEKAELQAAVDRQGMTVQDIDRLNTERERLQRAMETTTQRLEETKKRVSERETDAGQRVDGLERSVQEYNALGFQVGIIPRTAAHAKGQDYELSLHVNAAPDFSSSRSRGTAKEEPERLLADANNGYQAQHLLNLDMKGAVKSSIMSLRKEVAERKNQAAEVDMNNKDLLDKIREAIEDKQQEVDALGHRVRAAEEEFEKTREITNAQKMASDAQIEKLEMELARMRTTLTESVQLMEQREMNTNIEYEQLTIKAAALREELHTEVERMLNDIIKFKGGGPPAKPGQAVGEPRLVAALAASDSRPSAGIASVWHADPLARMTRRFVVSSPPPRWGFMQRDPVDPSPQSQGRPSARSPHVPAISPPPPRRRGSITPPHIPQSRSK